MDDNTGLIVEICGGDRGLSDVVAGEMAAATVVFFLDPKGFTWGSLPSGNACLYQLDWDAFIEASLRVSSACLLLA